MDTDTWAWVAHKDGKWAGCISPACGRKDVAKFCGGFIADGFTITAVNSREEYEALTKPMGVWHPEPKSKKTVRQMTMFDEHAQRKGEAR